MSRKHFPHQQKNKDLSASFAATQLLTPKQLFPWTQFYKSQRAPGLIHTARLRSSWPDFRKRSVVVR